MSDACRKALAELMQDDTFARAMRASPQPTLRRVKDRFDGADYQALVGLGRDALSVLDPAGAPRVPGAGPAAGALPPSTAGACGTLCVRYPIHGRVEFVGNTTRAVGGVTVELWEKDATWAEARASVVTDAAGRFDVALDERSLSTASPVIYFRVAIRGAYVAPDPAATWSTANAAERVVLTISGTHVEGYVRYVDGTPVAGSPVNAFASQMRTEDLLGSSTTDASGYYAIDCAYAGSKLDLIVRAYQPPGAGGSEIAHSALITDVAQLAAVDLVVGNVALAGSAEYTTIMAAIDGSRGAVAAKDLTEADVAQVAAKYVVPADRVQLAVDANGVIVAGVSAEMFYALGYHAGRVTLGSALSLSAADRQTAVDEAIARNRVTAAFAANAAAELAALAAVVTGSLLTDAGTALPTRLAMILRIAGLSNATDRQTLLNAYAAFSGTVEDFWANAPTLTGLASTLLDDVRAALHIGIYTLNHPPMVQSLWNSGIRTAQALGSLSTGDWATRIASTVTLPGSVSVTVNFPNEVVGANDAAKAANYAAALTTVNLRVFPSNAFRTAYTASPIGSTAPLAAFLTTHPDFDFAQQSIYSYVRANPTAFDGNPDGLGQVEKTARLFKIAPEISRYATAKSLWEAGFDSARSVYLFGKEPFVAMMTSSPYSLSVDTAEEIFSKSSHLTAVASTIAFTYAPPFQPPGNGGALTIQSASAEIPDWNTLFGSLDYCACDECASVYGPAAYLTDLLHFLEQRKSVTPSVTALQVIQARRPDLTKIELTCKNTNTIVPYIDLLNEQLELRVATATPSYQTTWSDAELAIHPEHLRVEAYDALKTAIYPWTQPYCLWVDESRSYIGLKSVSRAEVRGATIADPPSDAAWVSEVLGFTERQKQIIQGSGGLISGYAPNEYWGMPTGSPWFSTISTNLSDVPTMLKKSGLTYDELAAEVATKYVSTAQAPAVGIDLNDGCDVTYATLTNITVASDPFFSRLHRFDRIRRALGWTIHQTDRAIQTLGYGNLDAALPGELATVKELNRRTKAKVDDLLTWRSGALIDTAPDPQTGISPFEVIFPRRNALSTGDETFTLAGDRTKLAVELSTPPQLADQLTAIAKGFGTDVGSLQAIIDDLSLSSAPLTLFNISTLFRYVTLAKALKLAVPDLLALLELDGMMPFDVPLYRLPLTAWWRANYSGAPWAGTASSGASGSHGALTASADPTVGTVVNGLAPAHFDGTKYLRDNVSGVGAYISASGYRVAALVNVGTNAAPAANAYQDAAIVCDGTAGAWGIAVNANEVILYHTHGAYTTIAQPMTPGWHVIDVAYDGTSISLSVDGNQAVTATVGVLNGYSTSDPLFIGANKDSSAKFVGDIAELIICDQPLTNVSPAAFKSYLESRYALDLSWTPKRNIAGTTLFLRADMGITLNAGKVATWTDQSGVSDTNRNATQGTAANQPGYQPSNSHFAGNPTVDCTLDGAQERFLKTGAWSSPTISSDVTLAVVCRRAGLAATDRYLFDALSGSEFSFYENSTGATHFAHDVSSGDYASRSGDLLGPSAIILSAKNGQNAALRINSNAANATTAGPPGTFTVAGLTVGADLAGAKSDFEIAEFCVWLRQLTLVEVTTLNTYFGSRYGIGIAP